ncbi:putative cyclic nucleotide-gated ion channel 12 [Cardamine amara subsp. amara]|uniref:Cyclic nucleotide-gated ion channel 12 n=1 Tax=Cardamine amara subsp. amara TaxID=228776 RepID=A0ABD0ZAC2_CARAN
MDIQSQRSSFARLDESVNPMTILEKWRKYLTKTKILEKWMKYLLCACVIAVAIDPLFLFIPEIDSKRTCFSFAKNLAITVCILRSLIDAFYAINFFVSLIIEGFSRCKKTSRGESTIKAARKKPLLFYFYLFVDIVSVIPFPQVVVLGLIISSDSVVSKRILISFIKWIIVGQYIPRIIRIYPLYQKVTRTSATIAENNWMGAGLNLFLFMLYSYVFGAFWYVNAIEKRTTCWRDACAANRPACNIKNLFCGKEDNSRFLNTSCLLIDSEDIDRTELVISAITKLIPNTFPNPSADSSKVEDFGMYIDVLKSNVVEASTGLVGFLRKFVFCFWWGLRHLSTFAQSLEPGESTTDILFAIIICASGLFLFAVLIGNVQKYMITTTVRVEEMKEKKRDTEKWMSSRRLPENIQERIRKYDTYKWREFRGTEEEALLRSLPKDLRLETKCHLYKNQLKRVPFLKKMNDWLLEAVCDVED